MIIAPVPVVPNVAAVFATQVSASTGEVTFSLDSATSANIAPGRYVYDVLIKDTANTVTRVLEGIINVNPQVTRF